MKKSIPIYGLTGGIASGKSSVARLFEEQGIPSIDADDLSRSLSSEGGAAYQLIQDRFGTADRKKLREIVFSDPQAKKDLEEILHPLIQKETEAAFEKIVKRSPPFLVYEATLLIETGRYKQFSGLIVVEAPLEKRIERLVKRDGISKELAQKMISSQKTDEERRKVADWVLSNAGMLDDLRVEVQKLCQKIQLH